MQKCVHTISFVVALLIGQAVSAQIAPDRYVWIQIEAQPNRESAMARINTYRETISNVVGFKIGGGWFGITLGPYKSNVVDAELIKLKTRKLIPFDSFVARGITYDSQFYFPRSNFQAIKKTQLSTETETETETETAALQEINSAEQLKNAQISESLLTTAQKKYLQRALSWSGYYQGAIDGLYGPETRQAMFDWQLASDHTETGIMTQIQRTELINKFRPIVDILNLTQINNTKSGITVLVPKGLVGPAQYDAPFVRFEAKDKSNLKLILISQVGDINRLKALYEVIQTLDIVPTGGTLELNDSSFKIEVSNSKLFTTGFAKLIDGEIKGVILVWPTEDEVQRLRLKEQIFNSFKSFPGALPEADFFQTGLQSNDIISGLRIRQPIFTRSGTFFNSSGMVITASNGLEQCDTITLGFGTKAQIISINTHLAVLSPVDKIAPRAIATFQLNPQESPMHVTSGGFSYGGSL